MLDACIRIMSETLCDAGLAHEIILVDDGSRDRTAEIADRLARQVPFVQVHHQLNQGIGGAFRTGVGPAAGNTSDCGQSTCRAAWPIWGPISAVWEERQ
jgi:Glycosyl transferase family 2